MLVALKEAHCGNPDPWGLAWWHSILTPYFDSKWTGQTAAKWTKHTPLLSCCQLDPKENISMTFYCKIEKFSFKKMLLKTSSVKWLPFSATICLRPFLSIPIITSCSFYHGVDLCTMQCIELLEITCILLSNSYIRILDFSLPVNLTHIFIDPGAIILWYLIYPWGTVTKRTWSSKALVIHQQAQFFQLHI